MDELFYQSALRVIDSSFAQDIELSIEDELLSVLTGSDDIIDSYGGDSLFIPHTMVVTNGTIGRVVEGVTELFHELTYIGITVLGYNAEGTGVVTISVTFLEIILVKAIDLEYANKKPENITKAGFCKV